MKPPFTELNATPFFVSLPLLQLSFSRLTTNELLAMAPTVVLNVAEKPSVARALASVFSSPPARARSNINGHPTQVFECDNVLFPPLHSQGNGILSNARDEGHIMITTAVRGHLASQDFPPSYGWSKCPPAALFDAPIITQYSEDMQALERMLCNLSKRCYALILWLDCDREGEAISDEVRTACLRSNPRLGPRIYRAKFSTVLPQEIKRALRSLGRVNENFVKAVQARSEHDLRVGAAFTRFQTLRLQKKFHGFLSKEHGGGVVSYGPCQFPTLGFVVERWARIETFTPEDFWFLEMSIRLNEDGSVVNDAALDGPVNNYRQQSSSRAIRLNWKRARLYDRVVTLALYDACLDAGEAVVTSVTGRPKNKWRPVPLATVELQKRASKYLRIGSEELMQKAEELYQQGFISYPRTETEKFRPEFNHHELIQSFQAVQGELGNYANRLLSDNNFQIPRAGQNDDNAHPPITPCKAVDPSTINDPSQRKIYELVVKHYLACCSRDAIGRETELTLKIASEEFVAKGLMIWERNWLEIYQPWERWSTGQGELPKARVGTRITPTSLTMNEGQTTPPQPISEVELIALMDKNGIGTDATM
jgi:DNA topoisomerase-3